MIDSELADLLLKLQTAHQEAARNNPVWTPSAVTFHWNYLRSRLNSYSPDKLKAYMQTLLTQLAEAGSTEAWVKKWIPERPASAQTESAPESISPTAPAPDSAHEEPPPPPQKPIDYMARVRELLAAGKSPATQLLNLVNDPSVNWADDTQNWKKAYLFACLSELVYLRMSKYELRGKDRYKVIPSASLRFLLENSLELDLSLMMTRVADVPAAFTDSESLVIGIFELNEFIAIAVRGTMKRLNKILGDIAIDVDAKPRWLDKRAYHEGFYDDAKGALRDLVDAVGTRSKPIYFTGHSMGGAISGLLPSIWSESTALRLMTPYTFASPRFGNDVVADTYRNYAYVRAADPIPHVPTESMGYRSSGWPPTMLPTTDSWLEGWHVLGQLYQAKEAHSIEQYRKLVGEEAGLPYFRAQVYYDALKELLADPEQP